LIYAPDAVLWFADQCLVADTATVATMHHEVTSWLARNYLDIPYVIRSIGSQFA
jgi:hypothetical protein